MPLYCFFCDDCAKYKEMTMSLSSLDKFDRGKLRGFEKEMLNCPECGKPMRKLICPVRLSSQRCTVGC